MGGAALQVLRVLGEGMPSQDGDAGSLCVEALKGSEPWVVLKPGLEALQDLGGQGLVGP